MFSGQRLTAMAVALEELIKEQDKTHARIQALELSFLQLFMVPEDSVTAACSTDPPSPTPGPGAIPKTPPGEIPKTPQESPSWILPTPPRRAPHTPPWLRRSSHNVQDQEHLPPTRSLENGDALGSPQDHVDL